MTWTSSGIRVEIHELAPARVSGGSELKVRVEGQLVIAGGAIFATGSEVTCRVARKMA